MTTRDGRAKTRPGIKAKANRRVVRVGQAAKKGLPAVTAKRRRITKRATAVTGAARGRTRAASAKAASAKTVQARLRRCMRRIVVLEAELSRLRELRAKERKAARMRMSRARRRFESRLTRMVQELGQLRHHEVRARTLERKLAAREESAQATPASLPG